MTFGPHSKIKAQVFAKALVVLDEVNGNIAASEKGDIRDGGSVEGDIVSPRVAIAEGAHFCGSVDMQRKSMQPKVWRVHDGLEPSILGVDRPAFRQLDSTGERARGVAARTSPRQRLGNRLWDREEPVTPSTPGNEGSFCRGSLHLDHQAAVIARSPLRNTVHRVHRYLLVEPARGERIVQLIHRGFRPAPWTVERRHVLRV